VIDEEMLRLDQASGTKLNLIREVAAEAETVMDRDELLDPESRGPLEGSRSCDPRGICLN
jgi:hypothetical protein